MLLTKAINKIFTTTLTMFLILTIFTLTNTTNEKTLRTNMEIETFIDIPKVEVYLLSDDNYLVKTSIFLEDSTIEEKSKNIINNLKVGNNIIPKGLQGYLPQNIKVNSILYDNYNLKINFSKEFLNIENKELTITGIVYSLLNIKDVKTIEILVDNRYIDNYEYKLNKNIGINKEYLLSNRNNINKVVIYYIDEINNEEYLTPVTKYINDEREKVEIIVDELINNTPNNLISYLSDKAKLIDYKEENDLIILNFNDMLKGKDNSINKKSMNLIAESIFENYDVNAIMFQENANELDFITRNQEN